MKGLTCQLLRITLFFRYNRLLSDKRVKIFISYQDKDVDKACQVRKFVLGNSSSLKNEDVFVAHRYTANRTVAEYYDSAIR